MFNLFLEFLPITRRLYLNEISTIQILGIFCPSIIVLIIIVRSNKINAISMFCLIQTKIKCNDILRDNCVIFYLVKPGTNLFLHKN